MGSQCILCLLELLWHLMQCKVLLSSAWKTSECSVKNTGMVSMCFHRSTSFHSKLNSVHEVRP